MMMAAMAVICLCHGWSLRAAQHALLFQPVYFTGGKQVRDLTQVDLCCRTVVEYGERIVALAVVAGRGRHVGGIFRLYGSTQHVFRTAHVINFAAVRGDQSLVCEQEFSHPLLRLLALLLLP